MNLKESFRYQNFLDSLMRSASSSIQSYDHGVTTVKYHRKSKANPEAEDVEETVATLGEFFPNDDVIAFMGWLINEREKLTTAISLAKATIGFDVDAAIETNKFRQMATGAIRYMLRNTPGKRDEQGRDYKFNAEGNQTAYFYPIEVVIEDAFDREADKKIMRNIISEADKVSADIDAAMINTVVSYTPVYDVNMSFEDVMAEFVSNNKGD